MAKLSRGGAGHLSRIPLLLLALAVAAPADAVELEGTWHVLVHYTDENTSHPEQLRWDDRIWVFQRKGRQVSWTEYPIVVFSDESGRFERRSTGQYARVIGGWEPSPTQLSNIEEGLKINTRGSKTKTLRGSDDGGWSTTSRSRPASASVITFQENWSVEGLAELPVFIQQDVMGSGRSETMEGMTRWETGEVGAEGHLRGTFERDGTRHGTFVMRRSGPVGQLEKKTQAELQAQAARRGIASNREIRASTRELIDEALKREGLTLPDDVLDSVTDDALTAVADGVSREEILARVDRSIRTRWAEWARTTPEGRRSAREGVVARLPGDAELSDGQLDRLTEQVIELIAAGTAEEEIARRLRASAAGLGEGE